MPLIGIGASAGGIKALCQFFDATPADNGCAFIVVLHLDPKQSELAHVLSAHTAMPVFQVTDGVALACDHVYVIAPNTDLIVREGRLHIAKPSASHGHPVDVLFSSLALDQGEKAIAIVLSGTGSNGTEGLRAIRAEGGMSLVQSPETAEFDGMRRSAISAGMADHVLPPEKMLAALLTFVKHNYVAHPAETDTALPRSRATLGNVLELLRACGGYDFRGYKHADTRPAGPSTPRSEKYRHAGQLCR
ncbi:chemotaxis protein CheB [Pararhizobium sp. DWP3-4]|uniref:chemotaxis protein CheB n=1 Tax=Pararhizobium sp. DWP3-4 TaxID=2804565 RepID=UPI003CF45DFB